MYVGKDDRVGSGPAVGTGLAPRPRLFALVDLDDPWDDIALCREHDPTLFFGPNRFEPKQERLAREAEAKSVCQQCPALVRCREHALTTGELYGVWGGTSELDRRTVLDEAARRAG